MRLNKPQTIEEDNYSIDDHQEEPVLSEEVEEDLSKITKSKINQKKKSITHGELMS